MAEPSKSTEKLVEVELIKTGTPDDPAKQENPDTSIEQLQPEDSPAPEKTDDHPALDTTKKAGQGAG